VTLSFEPHETDQWDDEAASADTCLLFFLWIY